MSIKSKHKDDNWEKAYNNKIISHMCSIHPKEPFNSDEQVAPKTASLDIFTILSEKPSPSKKIQRPTIQHNRPRKFFQKCAKIAGYIPGLGILVGSCRMAYSLIDRYITHKEEKIDTKVARHREQLGRAFLEISSFTLISMVALFVLFDIKSGA